MLSNAYTLNKKINDEYVANFAHTEKFLNSAVPYCQRLLNEDHRRKEDKARAREQRTTTADRAPGQERGAGQALGQEGGINWTYNVLK